MIILNKRALVVRSGKRQAIRISKFRIFKNQIVLTWGYRSGFIPWHSDVRLKHEAVIARI
ncbi:hypothetical protein PMIT1312_00858 [Prochlorococcus marinus str. MIT 1312]|nr:hypothetical protein PMIT1312_00858 [Prochlorococcus marinus str. MIT 1312]